MSYLPHQKSIGKPTFENQAELYGQRSNKKSLIFKLSKCTDYETGKNMVELRR